MDRCRHGLLLAFAAMPLCLSACNEEPPPTRPPPVAQPVPTRPSLVIEPPCKPPHGGRLLAMSESRGHVEWLADSGRFYVLDEACQPVTGAAAVILTLQTPGGPEQVALNDCRDKDYPDSCWTSTRAEVREAEVGVMRFSLNGEPVRVSLSSGQPAEKRAQPPSLFPSSTQAAP